MILTYLLAYLLASSFEDPRFAVGRTWSSCSLNRST